VSIRKKKKKKEKRKKTDFGFWAKEGEELDT